MTAELVKRTNEVTAIELDKDLIPELSDKFPGINLLNIDALTFTPPETPYKLVANIPYYITSPIINHFLRKQPASKRPQQMTLLIQREVAKKICAQPGDLNVLALQVQVFGKPKIVTKVPASHFKPAPKVESAVIQIEIKPPQIPEENLEKLFETINKGFAHKRKKLSKNLGLTEEKLKQLGLSPNVRAQELTIEDWKNLISLEE